MKTRNMIVALAVAMALGLPLAAGAKDLSFNYIEANYIDVDVDLSDRFTDEDGTFSLETDSDSGFQLGGAWEVWERIHLFGEYSTASQDLTVSDGTLSVTGDFDVTRYRLGAGYALPVSDVMQAYGRASYDYIEFDDFSFGGQDFGSTDDSGFGAEVGLLWAVMPQLHLQPYVRYTSVGEIDPERSDTFDSDVPVGAQARWFVTDNFAVQAGYEYAEITTWSVGARVAF
jgi:opacity protein-like surface antigen